MSEEKVSGTSLFKSGGKGSKIKAWVDDMTYRPYKGAHRGFMYRLPVIGKKLKEKALLDLKK